VAREVREALRRKAPWITSAIVLLGSIALMVVPSLIGGGRDTSTVAVAGRPAPAFEQAAVGVGELVGVHVQFVEVADAEAARQAVVDDHADVGVVTGTGDGGAPQISAKSDDDKTVAIVRQALAVESTTAALRAVGLDDAQIAGALDAPQPHIEQLGEDRGGRIAAATAVSLTVYLLLFMVTAQVANGVAIEKANRVSEVLLAITAPRSLFAGKVVGVGLIGLLPLACGALPVVVRLVAVGGLPPDTGVAVASGAAWFVLGAGFYLSAAGALGALVERQEEVGSAMAGLSIALVGSYVIGQSAADSTLGRVLAILPFSSPMVEPARLALGVSSFPEVVVSLGVAVVSLVLMVRLATAIYERAVVRTGRRLHLRDVLRPATV
jgi:ABC-2 type transport system permease protein